MEIKLHKNAKTTPAVRKELQESTLSVQEIAKQYNVSEKTVRKWRQRTFCNDVSSRPHHLQTTLTETEEFRICFERKQFKKSMYDLTDTFTHSISRLNDMKVYRCLKRNGLGTIPPTFLAEERRIKKFHKYGIGYLHIDFLFAPKINGQRVYIFTVIDRVSKAAFLSIYPSSKKTSGVSFLEEVLAFYPYRINYILTDNGHTFNYNALRKDRRPKDREHPFVELCKARRIEYRTTKPYHPWTNGMVENFNKKVRHKVLDQEMFGTIELMERRLKEFVNTYNHDTKLRKLGRLTPAQFVEKEKGLRIQRIVT